jgi:hypothetical protein
MKPTNEPNIIEFISHISERNKIFVYNYNPRSVGFDMNKLNIYIHELVNNRENFVFLAIRLINPSRSKIRAKLRFKCVL